MKIASVLLAAFFAASGAFAAEFNTVQPTGSTVTFVSRQMGVPVEGSFGKFSAQIAFDPAKPEAGRAQIVVDLASIDAGSGEANDEVKGKAWFDIRNHPTATFASNGVKALGGNRYEARGKMTIKGRSVEIVAPFTATVAGSVLSVEGQLPISRKQYGIGEGSWSDPSVVADEVQIRFRLTVGAGKK